MKIKIHQTQRKEKKVYLKLQETSVGVNLVAVDDNGNFVDGGAILSISSEGVCLYTGIDKNIGFPTSCNGTIEICDAH